MSTATVSVTVGDERAGHDRDDGLDSSRWQRLAHAVLSEEDAEGVLYLAFVDVDAMAELNATHMGHAGPTDVLSFPIDGEDAASPADGDVPRLLGDVVICPAVAARNAPDHVGTVDDELALLVVHGVLHVLGWDHGTDDERVAMQARERHHLQRWEADNS